MLHDCGARGSRKQTVPLRCLPGSRTPKSNVAHALRVAPSHDLILTGPSSWALYTCHGPIRFSDRRTVWPGGAMRRSSVARQNGRRIKGPAFIGCGGQIELVGRACGGRVGGKSARVASTSSEGDRGSCDGRYFHRSSKPASESGGRRRAPASSTMFYALREPGDRAGRGPRVQRLGVCLCTCRRAPAYDAKKVASINDVVVRLQRILFCARQGLHEMAGHRG